eukprot:COSAG02_NODE_49550_length_326_cov_0.682819_1_plen_31_part_01
MASSCHVGSRDLGRLAPTPIHSCVQAMEYLR